MINWPAYAYSPSSRSRGKFSKRTRMSAKKVTTSAAIARSHQLGSWKAAGWRGRAGFVFADGGRPNGAAGASLAGGLACDLFFAPILGLAGIGSREVSAAGIGYRKARSSTALGPIL